MTQGLYPPVARNRCPIPMARLGWSVATPTETDGGTASPGTGSVHDAARPHAHEVHRLGVWSVGMVGAEAVQGVGVSHYTVTAGRSATLLDLVGTGALRLDQGCWANFHEDQ